MKKSIGIWSLCLMLTAAGCGGSSGSSTATDDTDSTEVTTESLRTLSTIPDLDVEALDAALADSSANRTRALVKNVENDSTEFSMAGCMARDMVNQFKNNISEFSMNLCVMKSMEANVPAFKVPESGCNYYTMEMAGGSGGNGGSGGGTGGGGDANISAVEDETITTKIKLCYENESLKLALCEGASQSMAMRIGVTEGKFDAQVTNSFESPFDEGTRETMRMTALLRTESSDDFAAGETASMTFGMDGSFGRGHIGVDGIKDDDGKFHTDVIAAFQSGNESAEYGSWSDQVVSKFDAEEGCSKFSTSGQYPAMEVGNMLSQEDMTAAGFQSNTQVCWIAVEDPQSATWPTDFMEEAEDGFCGFTHEGTECFSYDYDLQEEILRSFTYDNDEATYRRAINDSTLLDLSEQSISFDADEVWNCEAEGEFVALDLTAIDAAMQGMDSCLSADDPVESGSQESCWDQFQEETAEGVSGGDIDDGFGHDFTGEEDEDEGEGEAPCETDAECEIIASNGLCEQGEGQCVFVCSTDDDCSELADAVGQDVSCNTEAGFCQIN